MKKFALFTLVLILTALFSAQAFADAEMTLVDSTLIVYDGDDDGYFFGKVQNTGDKGGYYGSGTLELLDANSNVITTKNWLGTAPSSIYLEPGDSAFVRYSIWEKALIDTPAVGFNFTAETDRWGVDYVQVPCEAEFYFSTETKYDNEVFVTLKNNTDGLMFSYNIVAVLYDKNDKIVFVQSNSSDTLAIHPGSTITVRMYIDSSLAEYLTNNDMVPQRVEAFVYLETE